jgi:DNA-binding transcriptional LysR family regulator
MIRPELRELECFLAAAELLNFSRAARRLNLSQPPLTRHIQSLEYKLGVKLFERDTHSVALTASGRLYVEDVRQILARMDRAAEALQRTSAGQVLRLRLAFVGALLDEDFIQVMQRFRQRNPPCQLEVFDLPPAEQLKLIESGELDGGFVGARPDRLGKTLEVFSYSREPLVLALPPEHPLAGVARLAWKQLRGLAWVLVSRSAAPAFRSQFAEVNAEFGLGARVVQEAERVPAILTMVGAGMGVSLVAASAQKLINGGVVFKRMPRPQPFLRLAFVYGKRRCSEPLSSFISEFKNHPTVEC